MLAAFFFSFLPLVLRQPFSLVPEGNGVKKRLAMQKCETVICDVLCGNATKKRFMAIGMLACVIIDTLSLRAADSVGSAPACPPTEANIEPWKVITLQDCGVSFRIPPEYAEEIWEVAVNNAFVRSYASSPFDRIDLHVRMSSNADPERDKTKQQKDYEDFSECMELIQGHKAVFQSYRGGGAIITTEGKRFVVYHAEGLWQLTPNKLLQITGNFTTREAQEEFLVLLRTVKFL